MIWILLFGILCGTFAGLIPGVGVFVTLAITYPIIIQFGLYEIILFYVALASTTQYIGSVPAILFGVPGESSSLPAVKEGAILQKQGLGTYAISSSAIGSLVGSILVILFSLATITYIHSTIQFSFNTYVQACVLIVVMGIFLWQSSNRWWQTILLAVTGYHLAEIGYNPYSGEFNYYFGIDALKTGVPLYPVMIALFVFPILIRKYDFSKPKQTKISQHMNHFTNYAQNLTSSLRGTVIGFFAGLVPAVTTTLSSTLAHAVEKKFVDKPMAKLTAAETANNSASFSMLLPLLLLGIPITGSEAFLYNIVVNNGHEIDWNSIVASGFFIQLAGWLCVINLCALCLAWPLASQIIKLYYLPLPVIMGVIGLALLVTNWYIGSQTAEAGFYTLILFALLPIGYLLRKQDTLILVLAFMLHEMIQGSFARLIIMLGG